MPYLVVLGGEKRNIVHPIQDGCKVGRNLSGTKHLDLGHDDAISRGNDEHKEISHVEILCDNENVWRLRDCNSRNGTILVPPKTGTPILMPYEGTVDMGDACLFQIGASILLFVNVDERPSDSLVQSLTRDSDQKVRISAEVSHYGERASKSTEGGGPVQANVDPLIARWEHVRVTLKKSGLGDLLTSD